MAKRTSLPPLNPLHVFAVASRLESFTKAAKELNVTQSAVSRQVAALEANLNELLFRREKEGISLTSMGLFYRQEINAAFARIHAATEEVRGNRSSDPLRIRVYSTFAARWLIPRLPSFRRKHPDIELQMNTAVQPVDFTRDSADLAIQFGDGKWPGAISKLILPDVLQPVCSPDFLEANGPIRDISDLRNLQLIDARLRTKDWRDWLKYVDMDGDGLDFMEFPSSLLAYQAATSGLGVAMGQLSLVQSYVEKEQLVLLLDKRLRRDLGYYAIWPEALSMTTKIRAFLHWLVAESKTDWSLLDTTEGK